jgi:hypothetical protein
VYGVHVLMYSQITPITVLAVPHEHTNEKKKCFFTPLEP